MKFGFVSDEYLMPEVTSKEMEIVTCKLWMQMHLDKVLHALSSTSWAYTLYHDYTCGDLAFLFHMHLKR